MSEPTIPVPVSLIKYAIAQADEQGLGTLAREFRALLSQPTPSAGHTYEPCGIHGTEFDDDCGWCWVEMAADPPSIEDLAPEQMVGQEVVWEHGPNRLVGVVKRYDAADRELFIIPDGLMHGHYWVPVRECRITPPKENPDA